MHTPNSESPHATLLHTIAVDVLTTRWYPYLCIAATILVINMNSLPYGFLNYDESVLIVNNHEFLSSPGNWYRVFFHGIHQSFSHFFRPVLMISFMADNLIGGANPFCYRLTNSILHVVAMCLLYAFLCRLDHAKLRSLVFTLIVAIHPVLVPAVAWIPGRNDSLLGIGVFSAFIFLDRYLAHHTRRDLVLHAIAVFASFLIKETALAIIPVGAAFVYARHRNTPTTTWRTILSVWLLLLAGYGVLHSYAIRYDDLPYHRIFSYLAFIPVALIGYIGAVVLPHNLSVMPFANDISIIPGLVTLIFLTPVIIYLRKNPMVWFGLLWYVVFLLPTLVINWDGIYYLHRLYVPMIGLLFILNEVIKQFHIVQRHRVMSAVLVMATGVIFLLSYTHYATSFADSASFWLNATKTSPHSFVANQNMGVTCMQLRMYGHAAEYFGRAARIRPADPVIREYITYAQQLAKRHPGMHEQ